MSSADDLKASIDMRKDSMRLAFLRSWQLCMKHQNGGTIEQIIADIKAELEKLK